MRCIVVENLGANYVQINTERSAERATSKCICLNGHSTGFVTLARGNVSKVSCPCKQMQNVPPNAATLKCGIPRDARVAGRLKQHACITLLALVVGQRR